MESNASNSQPTSLSITVPIISVNIYREQSHLVSLAQSIRDRMLSPVWRQAAHPAIMRDTAPTETQDISQTHLRDLTTHEWNQNTILDYILRRFAIAVSVLGRGRLAVHKVQVRSWAAVSAAFQGSNNAWDPTIKLETILLPADSFPAYVHVGLYSGVGRVTGRLLDNR